MGLVIDRKTHALINSNGKTTLLALRHHRTHQNKPLIFKHREYLKEIYLDSSSYIVIIKSTQCGISEWLMVNSFAKSLSGRSVFYVLPTFNLAARFVKNRIDRTLQNTAYYKTILSTAQKKSSESVFLKHIGPGSIAFVGSNTPGVFTEYPADDLIIDEFDYCDQDNIQMGLERLSASEDKKQIRISNPTIEGFGIDLEYKESCQYEWHIKCKCGEYIRPDFFKHVVEEIDSREYIIRDKKWKWNYKRDINLICDKCGQPFNRKDKGIWIPRNPKAEKKGYHISKLFSTNVTIKEIVDRFDKGLKNDSVLQRFYNGDLGIAFTAAGANINEAMLDDCIDDYRMEPPSDGVCVAGVDVGVFLHVRISQVLPEGKLKAVYIGTIREYEELSELYKTYRVRVGVIDALPETRLSKKVASRLRGFFICYYGEVKREMISPNGKIVTVDRTQSLDAVKEAIIMKDIILPKNARSIDDYYEHMTASTRVFDEAAKRGEGAYKWEEGSRADHYFHAESYGLIARKVLVMVSNR